ncbi:MAG TPA: radical SAM family heme chaperone HemW [Candidatus Dormibacteraeota bacterium]|nr:radical SAM family heme chaperone HemW [Candidatus Dormibacteraeota bacterium]
MTAEASLAAVRSLYLHIPFCDTRCPYCDFAIHLGGDHLHRPYVEALIQELGYLAGSGRPELGLETVYLGGGTPGLLAPPLLEQLLEAVALRFGIAQGAEITIEANPTGLTEERCRGWLALGINRLSLGVQSLDDQALRWLGRNHDSATAEAAIRAATKAGLENLSCDLIYAIPEQPTAVFEDGLRRLLEHSPQHVSCYELTVESGTPLARSIAKGRVAGPTEQEFVEQHRLARELLEEAGLLQYEVSNYAQLGRQSRHNLCYWQGRHYLAAGCGAHGFVDRAVAQRLGFSVDAGAVGIRYWNLRSAATYIKQVAAIGHGRRGHEAIDRDQAELERLACGLRLRSGVELTAPRQLVEAERLAELGLLTIAGQRVAATSTGIEVLDRLTLELVAGEPARARS